MLYEEVLKENPYAANAVNKIWDQYDQDMQDWIGDILHEVAYNREKEIAEAECWDMNSPASTIVNRKDFERVLLEEFGLTEPELKNLIELVAPAFSDTINYKTFFNFLRQNIPHMDA